MGCTYQRGNVWWIAEKDRQLSPESVNHVRGFLVRAFDRARKAQKWLCGNPAEETDTRFPRRGSFRTTRARVRTEFRQPEDILRRAFKRAGIVTGYTHKCRRRGCGHTEDHADAEHRKCPKCSFTLWPKGNVCEIRFHDMRHTYASVLLMLGANLVSVHARDRRLDRSARERRQARRVFKRLVAIAVLVVVTPSVAEVAEAVVHLAWHGDYVHSHDGQHQPIGQDEHGCTPSLHFCLCHAEAPATVMSSSERALAKLAPVRARSCPAPAWLGRLADPPPLPPPIA
jgi:hypothetical protein